MIFTVWWDRRHSADSPDRSRHRMMLSVDRVRPHCSHRPRHHSHWTDYSNCPDWQMDSARNVREDLQTNAARMNEQWRQ